MGRRITITIIATFLLLGCTQNNVPQSVTRQDEPNEFAACQNAQIILMPHHLIVESVINEMYEAVNESNFDDVVIISPNHFNQGTVTVATPNEKEHGFTIHRDFVEKKWGQKNVTGIMVKTSATQKEMTTLVETLATQNALIIFSIDFSHYLDGEIASVHDALSKDVITARSIADAHKLEVDSPTAIEILLRLLTEKNLRLNIIRNTNPALDAGIETFENTTHFFGCSEKGIPPERQLSTTMYFAHPKEWYKEKTEEDRYLYGYDAVFFDQDGETDRAVIEYKDRQNETIYFNYFE